MTLRETGIDHVRAISKRMEKLAASERNRTVLVHPAQFRAYIRLVAPALSVLYEACWTNGYVVNGVAPSHARPA